MIIRQALALCIALLIISGGPASAADQCTQVRIESAAKIKSKLLQFYKLNGDLIEPFGDPRQTDKLTYPFLLEDCGLQNHYILREPPNLLLVEKAKFKCVITVATGPASGNANVAPAGSPGSGAGNDEC